MGRLFSSYFTQDVQIGGLPVHSTKKHLQKSYNELYLHDEKMKKKL